MTKENMFSRSGLEALLTPDECVLVLIDHQPFQFAGMKSHDPQTIINNVVGLAKTAKLFEVPTLLTTVMEERGGYLLKQLQDVFPEQKPINRSFINTWEDKRVTDWVTKTGRKKVIMAALWTEICLAFPVIHALGDGYDVYFVTDASGGVSLEAHEVAVQRMVQAGGVPLTWGVLAAEWQRDWAREKTAMGLAQIIVDHHGSTGTSFLWEQQLLAHGGAKK
jgi:nicotinamidase-related amidase